MQCRSVWIKASDKCINVNNAFACIGYNATYCSEVSTSGAQMIIIIYIYFLDSFCSQILMSVKTQYSLRAAAKSVRTSPAASCAAVRRASTSTTTSTASVRVTAQVRGQRSALASCLPDESELQQLFQESWHFPVKEKHNSLQLWGPAFRIKPHTHTHLKVDYVTVFLRS